MKKILYIILLFFVYSKTAITQDIKKQNNFRKSIIHKNKKGSEKAYSTYELCYKHKYSEIIEKAFKQSKMNGIKAAIIEFEIYANVLFTDKTAHKTLSYPIKTIFKILQTNDAELNFLGILKNNSKEISVKKKLFYALALEISEYPDKAKKMYEDVLAIDADNYYANARMAIYLTGDNKPHARYYLRKNMKDGIKVISQQLRKTFSNSHNKLNDKIELGDLIAVIFNELDEKNEKEKKLAFKLLTMFEKKIKGVIGNNNYYSKMPSVFFMYPRNEYKNLFEKRHIQYIGICHAALRFDSHEFPIFKRLIGAEIAAGNDLAPYIETAKAVIKKRPAEFKFTYAKKIKWNRSGPIMFIEPECLLVDHYNKNNQRQKLDIFIKELNDNDNRYASSIAAIKELDCLYSCPEMEFNEKALAFITNCQSESIVDERFVAMLRVLDSRNISVDLSDEILFDLRKHNETPKSKDFTSFKLWSIRIAKNSPAKLAQWMDRYHSAMINNYISNKQCPENTHIADTYYYKIVIKNLADALRLMAMRKLAVIEVFQFLSKCKYINEHEVNIVCEEIREAAKDLKFAETLPPMQDWDTFRAYPTKHNFHKSLFEIIYYAMNEDTDNSISKLEKLEKKTFGNMFLLALLKYGGCPKNTVEYLGRYENKISLASKTKQDDLWGAFHRHFEDFTFSDMRLSSKAQKVFQLYKNWLETKAGSEASKFLAYSPIRKIIPPKIVRINDIEKTFTEEAVMKETEYVNKAVNLIAPLLDKNKTIARKIFYHSIKELNKLNNLKRRHGRSEYRISAEANYMETLASSATTLDDIVFIAGLAVKPDIKGYYAHWELTHKMNDVFRKIHKGKTKNIGRNASDKTRAMAIIESAEYIAKAFGEKQHPLLLCSLPYYVFRNKVANELYKILSKKDVSNSLLMYELLLLANYASHSRKFQACELKDEIKSYYLTFLNNENISPEWRLALLANFERFPKLVHHLYPALLKLYTNKSYDVKIRDYSFEKLCNAVAQLNIDDKEMLQAFLEKAGKRCDKFSPCEISMKYTMAKCYFKAGMKKEAMKFINKYKKDMYSFLPTYILFCTYLDLKSFSDIFKKNHKLILPKSSYRSVMFVSPEDIAAKEKMLAGLEDEKLKLLLNIIFEGIPQKGNIVLNVEKKLNVNKLKALVPEINNTIQEIPEADRNIIYNFLMIDELTYEFPEQVIKICENYNFKKLSYLPEEKFKYIHNLFIAYFIILQRHGRIAEFMPLLKSLKREAKKSYKAKNLLTKIFYSINTYFLGVNKHEQPVTLNGKPDTYLSILEEFALSIEPHYFDKGLWYSANTFFSFMYMCHKPEKIDFWIKKWIKNNVRKKLIWDETMFLFTVAIKSAKSDAEREKIVVGLKLMLLDMPKLRKIFRKPPNGKINKLVENFRNFSKAAKATTHEENDVF